MRRHAAFIVWAAAILGFVSADLTFPGPQTAGQWARDALGCFDLLDYEMGLKLAGRSLDRDPDQAILLLRRAAVLWKLDRRDVAWLSVRGIQERDPRNWEALVLSAYFHFVENHVQETAADADKAQTEIDLTFHPDKGAKESWPKSYAFGVFDEKAVGSLKREFPPNSGLAAYLSAVLEERRAGWGPAAEALYRQAFSRSYDALQCALAIGLGRLGAGDRAGAMDAAREFLDRGGLRPELMFLAAAAEEAAGRRTDSESDLEIAVELRPFEAGWLKALAAAAADRSDRKEAASRINRAARLSPGDFEARDWAEAAARGAFPFRGEYGRLLRESAAALRRTLEPRYRYPLSGNINDVAPVINGRFLRFVQAGNFLDAAQYARNFLEVDSRSAELAYNAALLQNSLDRIDLAFPLVWLALANRPGYRDALDLAGHLLLKLGDNERAVVYYKAALDASPADAMAHFNLGFACQAAGRPDDAGRLYLRVIELERAVAEKERGGAPPGPLEYALDVKVVPLSYRALLGLGSVASSRGDLEAAERRLEQAATLRPQIPEAYLELGKLFTRKKDPARAKAAYDRYFALGGAAENVRK